MNRPLPISFAIRRVSTGGDQRPPTAVPQRHQGGTAVIVMLALLAIIMLFIAANVRLLARLDRELALTERHQLRRLHSLIITNTISTVILITETNAPATNPPALLRPQIPP